MTSLVSFSNLVDGAAAPVSETFESYNPYTGRPWSPIPRCKASDVRREKRKSSNDAYLQTKSLWIDYDWQDGKSVRHDEASDDQGRSLHFS
jgi:hypothetical protein